MAGKVLPPGGTYRGRRADITPMQFSLDREARDLLRHYAGAGKTAGRFISRLLFEQRAREEERQRLAQEQALAAADADGQT